MKTALLTGASGKVGKYVIGALARRGIEVVATDIVSEGIPEGIRFESCDLTDADAVRRLVSLVKPDVVVHCAAIVAPIAYAEPELAEAVNLGGTRHLIDATKAHAPDAFFVFVSSYAAFGPCAPGDPVRRSTDPCWPDDNYGLQKLTAESWLQYSGLRQCSLRLGAVMGIDKLMPEHPSYRPFIFMVSLDQPEHGVEVRDAARAIASAAVQQPDGHVFLIGGDDSWKVTARQLRGEVFAAIGLSMPPEKAFRPATDPSVKDGWFYEWAGSTSAGWTKSRANSFSASNAPRERCTWTSSADVTGSRGLPCSQSAPWSRELSPRPRPTSAEAPSLQAEPCGTTSFGSTTSPPKSPAPAPANHPHHPPSPPPHPHNQKRGQSPFSKG
jgi:nucleoside-diphosphate-sugar epimerase